MNTSEVTTIRPKQLRTLLAATIPAKLPILIAGKPGVGKTDIVKQAGLDAKAEILITHPVVKSPTDYQGMPWVTNGVASFIPFGDLRKMIEAKKLTMVFVDDLGQGAPSVQAALMQLFLEREIDGHKISPHVVFVAATNRRSDRAGVQGILEPVKSRFVSIVELEVNVNDWCTWAVNAGLPVELVSFMRFKPELLSDFKPSADMTNSPSPRSWSFVGELLKLGLPSDLQIPTIEGAVGKGAALEFVAFLRVWQQMTSPDVILTTPDKAPIPQEPSALCAISTALAMRVANTSMGRYITYLERMVVDDKAEFAAMSLRDAVARDPKLKNTNGYVKAMAGDIGKLMIGD